MPNTLTAHPAGYGRCSTIGCQAVADIEITTRTSPTTWSHFFTCFEHATDEQMAAFHRAADAS